MRRLAVLVCVFVAAGCVPAQSRHAGNMQEKQALDGSMQAFLDCKLRSVPGVDDGISDASTIALALTDACQRQYDDYVTAFVASNADNDRQGAVLTHMMNDPQHRADASLSIVLKYRARDRR